MTFYLNWTEAVVARSGGLDRDGIVQGFEPVTPDDLGRPVAKAGRITGVTTGIISQVEIDDFAVDLGTSTRRIMRCDDQLEVHAEDGGPFSSAGDSGSLIVDARGKARGLLFAGGPDWDTGLDLTFANRIESVLEQLGVRGPQD